MERVRGQNLRQWLHHHGNIGMAEVIELFEQVAEALVDVHAEGIVHRDLKPENLMVVREEPLFVKVLDFGVAHLAD
jgi:serine/threonine protein kinase